MHICFLQDGYPPDSFRGPGVFARTLGRALVGRGHHVSVVSVSRRSKVGFSDDQGVSVLRLGRPSLPQGARFLANVRQIRRTLGALHRTTPIDVMESNYVSLARASGRLPVVKLLRMHVAYETPQSLFRNFLMRRAFAIADELCAVSEFAARAARANPALGDRSIRVQPNPVDTGLFRPQPSIAEEPGLILFVGALEEAKGVRRLVRAFERVAESSPTARLLLVGQDPGLGSPFLKSIRDEIPADLAPRIVFQGEVPHDALPDILARAEACVFPADREAWGLTVAEAMAAGKAVVASRTGAGPELIENGRSGLLCNPHDPREIADRMLRVMRDPALRASLGKHARERMVQLFSTEMIAAQNEAYYEECIARHSSRYRRRV